MSLWHCSIFYTNSSVPCFPDVRSRNVHGGDSILLLADALTLHGINYQSTRYNSRELVCVKSIVFLLARCFPIFLPVFCQRDHLQTFFLSN